MLEGGGSLADAWNTLVAACSQKHFIYVWMAAGAQFCLAHMACCGLWHLFASLLSPNMNFPYPISIQVHKHICKGAYGAYIRTYPHVRSLVSLIYSLVSTLNKSTKLWLRFVPHKYFTDSFNLLLFSAN